MATEKKFKNRYTKTKARQRADAMANGRQGKQAYSSGARDVDFKAGGNNQVNFQKEAWKNNTRVQTYTSSKTGRMSTNGRTAGGLTHSFTAKDADGNTIQQSGRKGLATRRQRYYDIRVGLNLAGG